MIFSYVNTLVCVVDLLLKRKFIKRTSSIAPATEGNWDSPEDHYDVGFRQPPSRFFRDCIPSGPTFCSRTFPQSFSSLFFMLMSIFGFQLVTSAAPNSLSSTLFENAVVYTLLFLAVGVPKAFSPRLSSFNRHFPRTSI